MDTILKRNSPHVGHGISSRHFQRPEYDVLRRYIFYQTSWPLFRCQHDQATPCLPPEFAGLQQNETLRRRYDYQKRLDEDTSAKKTCEKTTTKSSTHAVSISNDTRNRSRSSAKQTYDGDRIRSANSLHLLEPDLWTCSPYQYTTSYGHLYELRKNTDNLTGRKDPSIWLWEDDYLNWLEKKGVKDPSVFLAGDSRHFKMPRTNKLANQKTPKKPRPHADVYAKFFEKNITKQKRKQIISTVQKIARGWLTRVILKRLSRKAQIHHKQTLAGIMQEYKDLIGRLRLRCDFPVNDYNLNLNNIEDYMNRKLTYNIAFSKVADDDNKLSLENIKSFFWNCRLYPTNKEIQMAIKKVSQSAKNRHDLMVLLENSNRLSEKTLSDTRELLEMLVSSLDLKRFRTRIGIATYTGGVDVISELGQTRDNNKILQHIKEMKPRSGHPYINQAFRLIQRTMQEFPRPWCQQMCLLVTGGRGLNREDVREEAMKIRQNGTNIIIIGAGDHVKTEESQQLVGCREHDFRLTNYESVQDLMNELWHRLLPVRMGPDIECCQSERFSKCDVLEVLWTIYPPKGVGLTGVKKSRWIRPVIDGEEAWSLLDSHSGSFQRLYLDSICDSIAILNLIPRSWKLSWDEWKTRSRRITLFDSANKSHRPDDDEILKKTDLKSCLRLVVKATLEREGFISIPSDDIAGVTKVTDLETALKQMEGYIQEKKKESRQKTRIVQDDVVRERKYGGSSVLNSCIR